MPSGGDEDVVTGFQDILDDVERRPIASGRDCLVPDLIDSQAGNLRELSEAGDVVGGVCGACILCRHESERIRLEGVDPETVGRFHLWVVTAAELANDLEQERLPRADVAV